MKTKPIITSYLELSEIPNFIEDNTITPDNFVNVVADYEIRERELKCCLSDNNGRCGQKHFHGYVIKIKDDSLSVMGKDCAERKFGAHGNIHEGISYYKKSREIQEKLGKVEDFVINVDEYLVRLRKIQENVKDIYKFYSEISLLIGNSNVDELKKRYKTQKNIIEVKTYRLGESEPDDEGIENLIYLSTHTIGFIPNLSLFDDRELEVYNKKITKLSEALMDGVRTSKQLHNNFKFTPAQLKKRISIILSQLNDFDKFEISIKEVQMELSNFLKADLTALCYLTDDDRASFRMAEYVLGKKGLNLKPSEFMRQLEIKYSEKYRCHRVKAAQHSRNWFTY